MKRAEHKREMRNDMRRIIENLDRRWILAASHRLCERLLQIIDHYSDSQQNVNCLLAWVPFFPGEVDLSSLIGKELSRRKIFLPRLLPEHRMDFIQIGDDWNFSNTQSESSIPEPSDQSGAKFDSAELDQSVIIVPGLAFDRTGNRLGRGKGYYDRFLSSLPPSGLRKIGVCWSIQLLDQIPVASHDVPMDCVVTEQEVVGEL